MKKTILLPFFLLVITFVSCKKDKPAPAGAASPFLDYTAYFGGIVVDSVTGTPVNTAMIRYYYTSPVRSNGRYVRSFAWGPHAVPYATRPNDTTDIYIGAYTANATGHVKFKAGILVAGDTVEIPAIHLQPVGYLNVHVKNISGVVGPDLSMRITYASDLNYHFEYLLDAGMPHVADTTFTIKAAADIPGQLLTNYVNNGLSNGHTYSVAVISGDTSGVSILY